MPMPKSSGHKPTETQKRILSCYADPRYKTITAVAEAAGVSRNSVYNVLRKPWPAVKEAKLGRVRKTQSIQERTVEDIRKSTESLSLELQALLAQGIRTRDDIQIVGSIHKLLLDTIGVVKQHDLETVNTGLTDEELFEAAQDLRTIFEWGHQFRGKIAVLEEITDYFLRTGQLPQLDCHGQVAEFLLEGHPEDQVSLEDQGDKALQDSTDNHQESGGRSNLLPPMSSPDTPPEDPETLVPGEVIDVIPEDNSTS